MGEVFRARDTKLNRDGAIKVLPSAFADDPERLARFTREAQTLASLNHPNIATIHGIEAGLIIGTSGHKRADFWGAKRGLVFENRTRQLRLPNDSPEGSRLHIPMHRNGHRDGGSGISALHHNVAPTLSCLGEAGGEENLADLSA